MEKLLNRMVEGNHYIFEILRVDDDNWTMNIIDKEDGNIIDSFYRKSESDLVKKLRAINRNNSTLSRKDFSSSKFDLGDKVIYVNDTGDVYKAEIFGISRKDDERYALVLYDKDDVVGYTIAIEKNINKFVDRDELEKGDIVTIKSAYHKSNEDFTILDKAINTYGDEPKVVYFVKSESGYLKSYSEDDIESIKINGEYFVIDNL